MKEFMVKCLYNAIIKVKQANSRTRLLVYIPEKPNPKKRGNVTSAISEKGCFYTLVADYCQVQATWPDLIISENPELQDFMWTFPIFKWLLLISK